MAAELFTRTALDVITRVKTQFGDTSGAQLNDATIIRWINDGQQEIVNNNAILKAVKTTDVVAGTAEYTFPTDKVQYIEALYVDGRPIRNLSPQGAREYIISSDPHAVAVADVPEVWYERAGVITLYPVPQKNFTNGLKLEYVQMPTAVTTSANTLSIPDRYLNELVNYCLVQAHEMDENYAAAQMKSSQFRQGLDRLNLKENISQSDLYPQVLPDPLDYV
jgi:hypothetical protein